MFILWYVPNERHCSIRNVAIHEWKVPRKPAKGLAPWNPSAALTLNVSAGGYTKLNETRAHP